MTRSIAGKTTFLMEAIRASVRPPGAHLPSEFATTAVVAEESSVDLVAAIVRGEEAALERAYRCHRDKVWAFAMRLVGDAHAAEDLVHEVFLRLPRALRGFRGESSLQTFIFSVAINHARHHVRAASRRRAVARKLARESTGEVFEFDSVERQQLALALTEALDKLPIDQRVAFVLCHVDERSFAAAAALTGASEGTMRARVFHARKKLRETLSPWRGPQQLDDKEDGHAPRLA